MDILGLIIEHIRKVVFHTLFGDGNINHFQECIFFFPLADDGVSKTWVLGNVHYLKTTDIPNKCGLTTIGNAVKKEAVSNGYSLFSLIYIFFSASQPFMEMRNSSLLRVPFIFESRNSMASLEFISDMNLRNIQTRCSSSSDMSRSSRRVPEAGTSMAG